MSQRLQLSSSTRIIGFKDDEDIETKSDICLPGDAKVKEKSVFKFYVISHTSSLAKQEVDLIQLIRRAAVSKFRILQSLKRSG
ncbi:hypothetical protein KIN20_020260 [Parelaphostrongylus tenuis]|uniref:Uncharacterized protein n=1 Tax=Parelaphostrongylus tenuis TaxID=148309 RepID=A0AAD5MSM3_PARTN|nr:hypothetical protein KIN20_020260 [Parelaphostrongylus tenuis]